MVIGINVRTTSLSEIRTMTLNNERKKEMDIRDNGI